MIRMVYVWKQGLGDGVNIIVSDSEDIAKSSPTVLSVRLNRFFLKWTSQNDSLSVVALPHVLKYWAIPTSDEVPASDNLENRLRGLTARLRHPQQTEH